MSHKESHEAPEEIFRNLELNEDIRCALRRAFEMNPEVAKELKAIVKSPVKFDFLREVLDDSGDNEGGGIATLKPFDEAETVYGQIAKRELERIEAEGEGDGDLVCEHTVSEHEDALRLVLEKFGPSIN